MDCNDTNKAKCLLDTTFAECEHRKVNVLWSGKPATIYCNENKYKHCDHRYNESIVRPQNCLECPHIGWSGDENSRMCGYTARTGDYDFINMGTGYLKHDKKCPLDYWEAQ